MRDPARFLKKILGDAYDPARFQAPEPELEKLVELLRQVVKLRKTRRWLLERSGIDPLIDPETFLKLCAIPEVDYTEVTDRDLNVTQGSLQATRGADDPVAVSHLHAVLRELFRDLNGLAELRNQNYPKLALAAGMSGDLIDRVEGWILKLRGLNLRGVGYLLTGYWAGAVERDFKALFPDARGVHPLREHLDAVQAELGFYHRCLALNIRWAATGLDLFRLLREDTLGQTLGNLTELGSGLWAVVYDGMTLKPFIPDPVPLHYDDLRTIFDDTVLPLRDV